MSVAAIAGLPRVRPIIQLGVGDSRTHEVAALWDSDVWDDPAAIWSGVEPYWVDVTCFVHEVSDLFVGHDRSSETWQVGTAELLLDNRTGWADYPRLGVTDAYLPVRPGVQVRVGVALDGATDEAAWWKWRGFIDEANPVLDPVLGETVALVCIDAKGEAGRGTVAKVDPAVGASEFVHQRIGRILDAQAWPAEWRNLQESGVRLVATAFGQSAVDAIDRASDSGGGAVFGDIDGRVTYRNYGWQQWDDDDPLAGVIGNVDPPTYSEVEMVEDPAGSGLYVAVGGELVENPPGSGLYMLVAETSPGDVCPTGWELSFARADFSNRVIVARADMDTEVIADDAEDIARYGAEPFTVTDLQTEDDAELENLAARLLAARNFALAPRVAAVTLDAAMAPNVVDLLAAADPRTPSRVLCRHRGEDGRGIINRECFVTGMRHTITPNGWQARLSLDDASPWRIGATEGVWDDAEWDAADWAATPVPI